jgi:hypothetical protein
VIKIRVTTYKDGRQGAWFRDGGGRVRTRVDTNWIKASQIRQVAEYGIALQVAQARSGVGSSGQQMPPLKGGDHSVFVARVSGKATFTRKSYSDWKAAHGLQPVRDLYGPGKGGHMLDDIRINYLDDRRAEISITNKSSRDKARANERRAPWWGWTRESAAKMAQLAGQVFQASTAEMLHRAGVIGDDALASAQKLRADWRRVAA